MTLLAAVVLVVAATTMFTLMVRAKDLPVPEPESPTRHLEERKAAIYENLRDLQFEFRVGKLSDADYQQTKLGLQRELAGVLAEIDKIKTLHGPSQPVKKTVEKAVPASNGDAPVQCPHCGAKFDHSMRFCGECGKVMA